MREGVVPGRYWVHDGKEEGRRRGEWEEGEGGRENKYSDEGRGRRGG